MPGRRRALGTLAAGTLGLALPMRGRAEDNTAVDLDTPYVPTPQVVVDRMLDMAQVRPGDLVIDLGSGDGRLIITAATRYGARGWGVDLDPRLIALSTENARRAGVADRVKFLQKDLFHTDFGEADVLTLYLLPDVNIALRPKILSELRPGTRVVSHDYHMREWRPDAEDILEAPDKTVGPYKRSSVYFWVVPAQVEGPWRLELASGGRTRTVALELRQQYQIVSGTVRMPGHGRVPVSDGRLRGDELRLALPAGLADRGPVQLTGKVAGGAATGIVKSGHRQVATWKAVRGV